MSSKDFINFCNVRQSMLDPNSVTIEQLIQEFNELTPLPPPAINTVDIAKSFELLSIDKKN